MRMTFKSAIYLSCVILLGINNLNSKKSGSTCGVKYLGAKMPIHKVLLTVKETFNSLYGNSSHLNQLYISAPIS